MSQLKLTADSGGGTVAIKGPASTTGNAALDLTVPGTASATLDTLGRSGNILQVKNAIKTDTASITSNTFTDISGLSISITPSSSSNKVLFRGYVSLGTEANTIMAVKIFRDSTEIGKSTADSTAANNSTATAKSLNISSTTGKQQMHQLHFEVLDSPNTTSATTYKVKFAETHLHNYSGTTIYVNRPHTGMGSDQHGVISSVTAMEVAA